MSIYENNKELLTAIGGLTDNLSTDFEVRKAILEQLGGNSSTCSSIYEVDKEILKIYQEGGGSGGGDITLSPITITENGVYNAGVGKGYNTVTVNVAGGGGGVANKLKIGKIQVTDECIVDGTWTGFNDILNSVDLNCLKTLENMFRECYNLRQLDVSDWDTSNFLSFNNMFEICIYLQSIDLSNWDWSNARWIYNIFSQCENLTSVVFPLTVGDKLENIRSLFYWCSRLQNIEGLNNLNTSNVTDMYGIFEECSSLTSLDLSGWNTNNATDMGCIFVNCRSLSDLNITGWNTSSAQSFQRMFENCSSLTSLDLSNWNTENVTNMWYMFNGCSSLTSLDVSTWNTSNTTDMFAMFGNLSALTHLDISNWNVGVCENMEYFLGGTPSLTTIDITNWNFKGDTYISRFGEQSGLVSYVGDKTIDEVINNNITIFNGLNRDDCYDIMSINANRASLRALINGLANMDDTRTLWLNDTLIAKLTDEDIAVAVSKNWTISA